MNKTAKKVLEDAAYFLEELEDLDDKMLRKRNLLVYRVHLVLEGEKLIEKYGRANERE